jgi:hypothetical protein
MDSETMMTHTDITYSRGTLLQQRVPSSMCSSSSHTLCRHIDAGHCSPDTCQGLAQ